MVCGSHAKTRAMYSTPPCPSLATSTAAYRRRSFSDSQPKNRFIFCSTSAEYPSMPHSLIRGLLCSKDTAAQAIREVILDHILSHHRRRRKLDLEWCPCTAERFSIDTPPCCGNCGLGTCCRETDATSQSRTTGAATTTMV